MPTFPRTFPRRGELYQTDFGEPRGSEQGYERPAVIVSNDVHNQRMGTVMVCPITTSAERGRFPQNVSVAAGELPKDSVILGEQVRTIDQGRLIRHRGEMDASIMAQVDTALRTALDLG